MRRWFPETAQGQIIAILIGSLLATFALIWVFMSLARPERPPLPPGPWPAALRAVAVIDTLHAVPRDARASIAQALSNDLVHVQIGSSLPCAELPTSHSTHGLQLLLNALVGDRAGPLSFRDCGAQPGLPGDTTRIEVPLDDVTVTVRTNMPQDFSQIVIVTLPLTVGISFLLILVVALSLWALWRINYPLRKMAATVEKFGLSATVAPLPDHGPRELRTLARSFNRMELRIAQLIDEQSHMLLAVGHDLRTPLTRLRLRLELDDTPALRQEALGEVDLMQRLINSALSFLNNRRSTEAFEEVDLGALVESICIGFADSGKEVLYTGAYGLNCSCQPTAITRAMNNLIENGCRYGTRVVVDVRREDQHAVIDIADNGPGIPADKREIVTQPFARLDPARASDGGLGLGLSIVRDVVRRHGAELILMDASPGGLLVRIRLPLGTVLGTGSGRPSHKTR